MQTVVDGLLINYEVIGRGSCLVILHGWQGQIAHWTPIAKSLSDQHKVVLLDLPGFGASQKPKSDWGIYEYGQFLANFLTALNISKPTILGHSFGGRMAIVLAAKKLYPIDKLVLVDAAGMELRSPLFAIRNGLLRLIKPILGIIPENVKNVYRSEDYARAGELKGILAKVVRQNLRKEIKEISVPTLIIWGEKDREVPIKEALMLRDGIKNSKLRIVWGASHWPQQEKAREFLQILREENI